MRQVLIAVVFLIGCNSGHRLGQIDPEIGASCSSDRDCQDRCFVGGDFPGGFCTLTCASDRDCPSDTFCMDVQGGACMYICPDFDCARLGGGWSCRDTGRIGGGQAAVCRG